MNKLFRVIGTLHASSEIVEVSDHQHQEETERKAIANAKCVCCGLEWVDVLAGFDTCEDCIKRQ